MGKTMDALLRRNFKTAKFKSLVNLSISRLAVLKNQRQVRCSHARSDTAQLLNLGHQDRALLRAEVVIKEQNMLDVFVMIEGYCHVLIERIVLIEKNKECPDELKEAASSLIYATSRSGDLPELQEIRSVFATRFGKDFVAQAVELRNNCGVNPKMIQKLSTRQPSYENRKKMLQEIASENGVTLHLDDEVSITAKEKLDSDQKQNEPKTNVTAKLDDAKNEGRTNNLTDEVDQIKPDEQTSGSLRRKQRYSDVASAAQAAFESAAYAAAAARAAVELSRSESQDSYPNDGSSHRRRYRSDNDGSSRSGLRNHVVDVEADHSTIGLNSEKIHPTKNSSSESESEELHQSHGVYHPKDFKGRTNKENMERSLSASSSDSAGDSIKATKMPSNVQGQRKPSDNMVFDESDDETTDEYGAVPWSNDYGSVVGGKSSSYTNEFPETRQHNTVMDSEREVHSKRLHIERRPISVRNRRENRR